jgi:hypothetical protein
MNHHSEQPLNIELIFCPKKAHAQSKRRPKLSVSHRKVGFSTAGRRAQLFFVLSYCPCSLSLQSPPPCSLKSKCSATRKTTPSQTPSTQQQRLSLSTKYTTSPHPEVLAVSTLLYATATITITISLQPNVQLRSLKFHPDPPWSFRLNSPFLP